MNFKLNQALIALPASGPVGEADNLYLIAAIICFNGLDNFCKVYIIYYEYTRGN
jgi:hypothetical protein